ncbi:CapA family protein [Legionella clemsonensis]|uniref:Capsule biosynthesis protein CapA n=1 Tax=Legionella clemsonensis TaxID=1867846 RepID=A0A222NZ49_9GAMM|nr:CapA family protein [Legionella clemsonensis]ASQ44825.1 Capsule biosynthesis protein CapA [Legionella clemsonensis]
MNAKAVTRLMLGGDVMLGRLVKEAIRLEGIDYPLGKIAPLLRPVDGVIVNLECAITTYPYHWSGAEKAFYFGAPPEAARILANCGVKLVSLANNHILDFDREGLLDTLDSLNQENIVYAGAGHNEIEAYKPAAVQIKSHKVGMAAFCDHQLDFSATATQPGMAYLELKNERKALKHFECSLQQMQCLEVTWPILSLHWGPNMVLRPAKEYRKLAHAAVDMGYQLIFGHSAHVFHGIEIYNRVPIIYAAGDLVDDYYVDPQFKNDHQLLFELEITEKTMTSLKLHPIFISYCQAQPANKTQFNFIAERMHTLCAEFGTKTEIEENALILKL